MDLPRVDLGGGEGLGLVDGVLLEGAQVRRGEKGTLVQYCKFNDQIPVKDERGKPLKDAEGNKVYRSVQLDTLI